MIKHINSTYIILLLSLFVLFLLFNDGHILHLRPETVAVHRWMRNRFDDGQMIPGDKYGLNFPIFVLQLRENSGK